MIEHRLILYAHGSEDPRWRQPFERLTADLQQQIGSDEIRLAYMEFAPPTLADVAAEAVRDGARKLSVLPLFMAAGAHLAHDLPEQVAAVRAQFGELEVNVLPPVGEDKRLQALLRLIVIQAVQRNKPDS